MENGKHNVLDTLRHSAAHVMAGAVLDIFPDAKFGIGPSIENGFYYDFDLSRTLTPDDLAAIEEKMRLIVKEDFPFEKRIVGKKEALAIFKAQPYKLELIRELPDTEEISVYSHDSFTDLCRGPHLKSTKQIHPEGFKLLSIAGAYWKGNEKNPMLQRIYGTAWEKPADLRQYLAKLAEIEKRDHRKVGQELELYSMHEEAGAGFAYWHPKGARIRHEIEEFWKKEHYKNGYEMVYSPHLGKSWLWETSGHLGFYRENMYAPLSIDDVKYYVKPMNCPFHIMIYKSRKYSYRELPLRWAELGTVYRYERSGVLHGLLRVRGFTQDDAHIICTPEQIEDEIFNVLEFSLKILKAFGFTEVKAYLATRPEGSVGKDCDWEKALVSLKKALERKGMSYEVDEGGGVFYGPKIDLKIKDALGREWQLSTIQFDFNLPERFYMTFTERTGEEKRCFMVHRALLGSMERFFGILIEHYGGAFPVWLSPVQSAVIPVAPPFEEYAADIVRKLKENDIRAEADLSDNRFNARIRNAQQRKIPYMLVVGEKEKAGNSVSVRLRTGEQLPAMPLTDFITFIAAKIAGKELI